MLPDNIYIDQLRQLNLINNLLNFNILQAQELPKSTIGELYYSTQEGLDVNKNKVQSRPKIGKPQSQLPFT